MRDYEIKIYLMRQQKVFLVGINKNTYRCGEKAEIIGLRMVTPEGNKPTLGYLLLFDNGKTNFAPCSGVEIGHYEIVTE